MSLSHTEHGAGQAAGVASAALPRLPAGGVGYAAWVAGADVSLERAGALGIHRKPMAKEQWLDLAARVDAWREEELSAAIALTGGGAPATASQSSTGVQTPKGTQDASLSTEAKEARKLVGATVERSRRIYGLIYAALPEELRPQVAHLPQGWAHGLWQWLQAKFQSTEEDSVGELLGRWTSLRQEEGESFDAYRARVNQLRTLLEAAKEKPSSRMYAYMLLDRLQPRYKPAVLALKAGGQLKDAEAVAWDTITALINAHERQEQRIGADGGDGAAMAAAARSFGSSGSGDSASFQQARSKRSGRSGGTAAGAGDRRRGGGGGGQSGKPRDSSRAQDPRTCFRCGERGHIAAECAAPPARPREETAPGQLESRPAVSRCPPRRAQPPTATRPSAATTRMKQPRAAASRSPVTTGRRSYAWRTRRAAATVSSDSGPRPSPRQRPAVASKRHPRPAR